MAGPPELKDINQWQGTYRYKGLLIESPETGEHNPAAELRRLLQPVLHRQAEAHPETMLALLDLLKNSPSASADVQWLDALRAMLIGE